MLFLGYIEKFYAFLQRKSEFDKKSYDEIRWKIEVLWYYILILDFGSRIVENSVAVVE